MPTMACMNCSIPKCREPGNRTFTKDPELDKLLDDGRKENDPEQPQAHL